MTKEIQDFYIDIDFFESVSVLSEEGLAEMYEKLNDCHDILPMDEVKFLSLSGVIKSDNLFFDVYIVKDEDGVPIFLSLDYIELDDYLDSITKKSTVEQLIKIKQNGI